MTGEARAEVAGAQGGGWARVRSAGRRPSVYAVAGCGFWLLVSVVARHTPIMSDFGQHASAVQRVRDDPWHPANPLLREPGDGSPYYSPYVVALGLAARATGAAGRQAVRWAGPVNLAVLLLGVGAYVRTLSARRSAPVYALAALTLLWGVTAKEWSGFCDLWSLTRGASYPSTFATGLALLLWAWTDRLARRRTGPGVRGAGQRRARHGSGLLRRARAAAPSRASGRASRLSAPVLDALVQRLGPVVNVTSARGARPLVPGAPPEPGIVRPLWEHLALGAAAGVLLLVHPITALGAAVGMAATVAGRQRGWPARVTLRWGLTAAAALAVAAAWPYFDVFTLAGDTTVDQVHRRLYTHPWQWYGLALVGLPALLARARRSAKDPLVLMFAAYCLIAGYGWLSGHYTYGRVIGLLLLPLQFALAVELAAAPPWTRLRTALAPLAAVALALALTAQVGAVVPQRWLPVATAHPARWPDYRWVADRVPPGAVVLTDADIPLHVLPAYGLFLVAPTWPDPSTAPADRARRWSDVTAYFARGTSDARRTAIAHRYGARWLLLPPRRRAPAGTVPVAASPRTGERLLRVR